MFRAKFMSFPSFPSYSGTTKQGWSNASFPFRTLSLSLEREGRERLLCALFRLVFRCFHTILRGNDGNEAFLAWLLGQSFPHVQSGREAA